MADQSTIDVYAELYRRNAVPPEHAPIVDELVKRGLIKAGPKYGPGDRLEDGTVLDDQGLERGNILPIARDPNTNSLSLAVPGFIYHPYKAFEKSAQTGEITPADALSIAGLGIAGTGAQRTIASPNRESWLWGRGIRRAEENAARARDFEAANVPVFAPALVEPAARAAKSLMETPAGFPLRTGARDSIQAIEQGVRDVVHEAGGTRPVNEIGQEIQQDLRRNLTERSYTPEEIQDMSSIQLHDISGIPPGPNAKVDFNTRPIGKPRWRGGENEFDPNVPGILRPDQRYQNYKRYQQEVDDNSRLMELQERAKQPTPWRIGGVSREPYMTEFDAGYEATRRNTPKLQANLLGSPDDVGLTETARLLDSVAMDMRKQGLLPGYKAGRPFDDAGRVRDDVLALVDQFGGPGVSERIRALSDMRTQGAVQLSVDGLDKIKTAIGQALQDARQKPIGGQLQGEGATQRARAAFLSRLYDAVNADIDRVVSRGTFSELAGIQRSTVRRSYEDFMRNVRGPLAKVFGEKTTPEQAVRILTDAARGGTDGNANLLRAYFRVADEKGDRVRATGVLLNSMLEDGLTGFLARWRDMPLVVKQMVFTGPAAPMGRRLDQLARAGGYLERFADAARPVQGVGDVARRAASGQNVLTALMAYINAPTAIAMMGGQAAASQVLASRAFQSWLLRVPTARTQAELNSVTSRMMQIAATQMGLSAKEAREMAAMVNGGRNDNK